MAEKNRVIFLLDGFNIYHSLVDASNITGVCAKWLNYSSLCNSYLHVIGGNAVTEKIYYFTALANHLVNKDPDKVNRHHALITCLKDLGINVVLGRFKNKEVYCYNCKTTLIKHEEKETDVAISVKLFEIFHNNEADTAAIITGDTDIVPAMKTVKRIFPDKKIVSILPYKRNNDELKSIANLCISIKKEKYIKHLLPDIYKTKDGKEILKPATW